MVSWFSILCVAAVLAGALLQRRTKLHLSGKHVLITGGSTGIGFALAKRFILEGCKVSLIARNIDRLREAKAELAEWAEQRGKKADVYVHSADVTNKAQVKDAIDSASKLQGTVDVLVCNAGAAKMGYFHELADSAFESQMDLNYFGSLRAVRCVYSAMLARGSGHICIVSSTLGTLGIIGTAAYAPTKYALRGLADALRNETQGTAAGVSVSIAFPPDTDTPGLAAENAGKPEECRKISEGGGLYSADAVADKMVLGIRTGRYELQNPDPILELHARLAKGFSPRRFPGVLLEMVVGAIGPLVYAGWAAYADSIAARTAGKRASSAGLH